MKVEYPWRIFLSSNYLQPPLTMYPVKHSSFKWCVKDVVPTFAVAIFWKVSQKETTSESPSCDLKYLVKGRRVKSISVWLRARSVRMIGEAGDHRTFLYTTCCGWKKNCNEFLFLTLIIQKAWLWWFSVKQRHFMQLFHKNRKLVFLSVQGI